jgi:hypothetical protein
MRMSLLAKQRKIFNYAANQEIVPIRLGFVKSFLVKGYIEASVVYFFTLFLSTMSFMISKPYSLQFHQ